MLKPCEDTRDPIDRFLSSGFPVVARDEQTGAILDRSHGQWGLRVEKDGKRVDRLWSRKKVDFAGVLIKAQTVLDKAFPPTLENQVRLILAQLRLDEVSSERVRAEIKKQFYNGGEVFYALSLITQTILAIRPNFVFPEVALPVAEIKAQRRARANWKIVEVNEHTYEQKVLYKGPSESDAVKAYHFPNSLPFGEKRVYQGAQRVYPFQLPSSFFQNTVTNLPESEKSNALSNL